MIGLIDVENILTGYDLRVGRMEIRRTVSAYGPGYILYHNGDGVSTSADLGKLWDLMTAEIDAESVEVVSLSPYERNKRFTPKIWADAPDYDMDVEREPEERYARDKETVSDILPDYRITIGDIYGKDEILPTALQFDFLRENAFCQKFREANGYYPNDEDLLLFFEPGAYQEHKDMLTAISAEESAYQKTVKLREDKDYRKTMSQYGTMVDHI